MDSKLPHVGTTIFTVMSQLAQDCGAINLSQGFPSFEPDARLLDLVTQRLHSGANQYAPMTGVPALRQAIAAKAGRLYDRGVDADAEVTVTAGATEALFCAIHAVVRPGDEVIVLDPAYDSYEPAVTLAGGATLHLPLVSSAERPELHIDWQRLRDAITDRTRVVMLNFPHNPTGTVLGPGDLDTLAEVVRDTGILIISDEVYEHIIFDGASHLSVLRHDELWQRAFVISSFGKTYHATGWKVGYCVAPEALSTEFRKVHQFNCFCVVSPIQHALADFMQLDPAYPDGLADFYQQKRDQFCALMRESRFRFVPAAGTYFQVLDYSAISAEDDIGFARRLTREIGVASIPVSVFCASHPPTRTLRFCFAKDDDVLKQAATLLCEL
ncbi:MAG: methionine aminotransferase [Gammaproteobacteria bacterium]|nr:methionine aminotransferase [Gammaproteobacteria bacterium]MDH4254728.1 methionine aminotransferase [Gammaproteobacteria bacterium]MDH5308694.1 methionine aminotransferase [Gammaproteobacteria bacterium]